MKARISEVFWWPGWWKEADDYVNACVECQTAERTQKRIIPRCFPVELPRGPWEKVCVDIKDPLNNGGPRYLIVCMDYYSKWLEVIGTNDISSD